MAASPAAMSSSSLNKVTPGSQRRRIVTYGKSKPFAAQTFDEDFDEPAKPSLKSPSRLRKVGDQRPLTTARDNRREPVAPAKSSKDDFDLFDVPSSGDEKSRRPRSPQKRQRPPLKTPKAQPISRPAPKKSIVTPTPAPRQLQTQSVPQRIKLDAAAQESRKRKRDEDAIAAAAGLKANSNTSPKSATVVRSHVRTKSTTTDSDSDALKTAVNNRQTGTIKTQSMGLKKLESASVGISAGRHRTPPRSVAKPVPPKTPPARNTSPMDVDIPSPATRAGATSTLTARPSRKSTEPAAPVTPKSQKSRSATPGSEPRTRTTTPKQTRIWDNFLSGGKDVETTTKKIGLNRLNLHTDDDLDENDSDDNDRHDDRNEDRNIENQRDSIVDARKTRLPRKKLIDTLIPSAYDIMSSDISSEDEDENRHGRHRFDATLHAGPSVSSSSQQLIQSSQTPSSQLVSQGTLRNTYAGQRSYLEEPAMTLDELLSQPLEMDDVPLVSRNAGARKDDFDFPDDGSDEERTVIKSIHELRARGGTRRLEDEISTLCDELGDRSKASLSARRSTVMELFKKLMDASFRGLFIQNSYESRVFSRCAQETDAILGSGIAACLIQILETAIDLRPVLNIFQTGVLQTLSTALEFRLDLIKIAKDRQTNMSKMGQTAVAEFKQSVQSLSSLQGASSAKELSPQSLALKAIDLLVGRFKEKGVGSLNNYKFLDETLVTRLLDALEKDLEVLAVDSTASSTAVETASAQLGWGLTILESSATSPACASDPSIWTRTNLSRLVEIMDAALASPQVSDAASVQNLVVRLCISLANNNKRTCDLFALPAFISRVAVLITAAFDSLQHQSAALPNHAASTDSTAATASRLQVGSSQADGTNASAITTLSDKSLSSASPSTTTLDNLLLSLGALINLVEYSDLVRTVLLSSEADHISRFLHIFTSLRTSPRPRPGTGTKHASSSGLAAAESAEPSVAAATTNVAASYLAVLLGNLCQNRQLRSKIKAGLPGNSLALVIDAVEEFIRFNIQVDDNTQIQSQSQSHQDATAGAGSGAGYASGVGVDEEGMSVSGRVGGNSTGQDDAWVQFTQRLQGVAESLRRLSAED